VVAEIAGGCTRFFLFPSPTPSDASLSASLAWSSSATALHESHACVRDDTLVLSLLCTYCAPVAPPRAPIRLGDSHVPMATAHRASTKVGRFLGLTLDGCVPAREWQQVWWSAHSFVGCCRLWPAGGGDKGPGMVPEGCEPS